MPKQLLLGSGDWNWPEWTSIDGSPHSPSTYHALIPPLPAPVLAQKWERIMAVHFIEHLPPWKALELLKQCYSILCDHGELILEQPNIKRCAEYLLAQMDPPDGAEEGQFDMWGFYGDPSHGDELMLHRWGYYPSSLRTVLRKAGFRDENIKLESAKFHQPVRDFRMVAVK